MEVILSDENTYLSTDKNPVNRILFDFDLKEFIGRWRSRGYISDNCHKSLNSTIANLPRAYSVPKLHKKDNPLRIIISYIDTPLHKFASYIHNIIQKSLLPPPSHVYNSYHLAKMLPDITFNSSFELISLDVVSLYTNILWDMALRGVEKRWPMIQKNTSILLDEFILALQFVFHSTFFTFNNKIYSQIFGAPMGSPLFPILASVVLQDLEVLALSKLNFKTPLYVRYVDSSEITVHVRNWQ